MITLGIPVLLHERFDVSEKIAVAVALFTAFLVNFLTTRLYVFGVADGMKEQAVRFLFTSIGFRVTEYLAFLLLLNLLNIFYGWALIMVVTVSMVLKFFLFDIMFFRRKCNP